MKTTIQELDQKFMATLEGELDTAAAAEVEEVLQPLYKSSGKDVCIDCEKLEYISSSGLRIFLNVLKTTKARGGHVFITGMNADINKIFAMTGFTNLFEFR